MAKRSLVVIKNSCVYMACRRFSSWIREISLQSFFAKVSKAHISEDPVIFENSIFLKCMRDAVEKIKNRITAIVLNSKTLNNLKLLTTKICNPFIKPIAVIIFTAVLMNITLIIILNKAIGPGGYILRIILLVAAFAGLYSDIDFTTIKNSSFFIVFFNNCCKSKK